MEQHQIVNYITERCVFTLTRKGLELVEVAPGIDIDRDIIQQMEFKPIINMEPRMMNAAIYTEGLMDMKKRLFGLHMSHRLYYNKDANTLFADLSTIAIHSTTDIDHIIGAIRNIFNTRIQCRAHVEVNYDGLEATPEMHALLVLAREELEKEWYLSVRRHTGRTFNHSKAKVSRKVVNKPFSLDEGWTFLRHHHKMIDFESYQNMFSKYDTDSDGMLTPDQFSYLLRKL